MSRAPVAVREQKTPPASGNKSPLPTSAAPAAAPVADPVRKYVYALRLEEDWIYVGITTDPNRRVAEHITGAGSWMTRKFMPLQYEMKPRPWTHKFFEDLYVKTFMDQYGIAKVRGGSYCKEKLTIEQKHLLLVELDTANDRCFVCHKSGHFEKKCTMRKCTKCYAPFRTSSTDHVMCEKCFQKCLRRK